MADESKLVVIAVDGSEQADDALKCLFNLYNNSNI